MSSHDRQVFELSESFIPTEYMMYCDEVYQPSANPPYQSSHTSLSCQSVTGTPFHLEILLGAKSGLVDTITPSEKGEAVDHVN